MELLYRLLCEEMFEFWSKFLNTDLFIPSNFLCNRSSSVPLISDFLFNVRMSCFMFLIEEFFLRNFCCSNLIFLSRFEISLSFSNFAFLRGTIGDILSIDTAVRFPSSDDLAVAGNVSRCVFGTVDSTDWNMVASS